MDDEPRRNNFKFVEIFNFNFMCYSLQFVHEAGNRHREKEETGGNRNGESMEGYSPVRL